MGTTDSMVATESSVSTNSNPADFTKSAKLLAWIDELQAMLKPDAVRWCDGSGDEYQEMLQMPKKHLANS